ncbi:ribosomal protein L1p/L10e family-domain-containing protein [Schizophyllum commune]
MAVDQLIDGHVSQKQAEKALNALLAYATKRAEKQAETELLGGREQHVWLNIAEKTIVPNRRLKPQRIPLAHPIIDPRVSSICLLTKDPQRQYKDLLETHKIRFISRVVGVEKLKGKFKPFEARRGLLKDHDMFLADERIIPLLPKLLGTKWFKAKKQPIPVCLTRKDLKGELERAVSSTYMSQNQGTQTSIKIGTISQKPAHLLDNLRTALPAIVARIKGGWENVQNIHIKTSSSTSLPVWSCDLSEEALGRWGGGVKDADVDMDASEEDEGSNEEEDAEMDEAPVTRAKGKRRAEAEVEEEPAQPKKRAKISDKPTSKTAANPTSKSADTTAPKTKKPRSKAGATAATKPKPSAATEPPATTDAAPQDDAAPSAPPSKKRKAKKGDAAEDVSAPPAEASAKKGKKDKTDKAVGKVKEAKAPASDAPVAAESVEKTKKVKKGSEEEASPAPKKSKAAKAVAPAKDVEAPAKVQAPAKKVEAPTKKSKAAKESPKKAEAPAKAADAEVDFKKKREGKTGEKKKEKVAKARPGKPSAKEGVLGKKALRA